eukprot:TRINITY_DN9239_c0_g1_i3.p2 TRINITY_DN9239_c0_g1~~TRINITY_DN9239_c0_g1_i3.p2  ORF type:complete len:115 (-),score=29.83 TRINITY_DN9239_c0_g1_i3:19-363(-)
MPFFAFKLASPCKQWYQRRVHGLYWILESSINNDTFSQICNGLDPCFLAQNIQSAAFYQFRVYDVNSLGATSTPTVIQTTSLPLVHVLTAAWSLCLGLWSLLCLPTLWRLVCCR